MTAPSRSTWQAGLRQSRSREPEEPCQHSLRVEDGKRVVAQVAGSAWCPFFDCARSRTEGQQADAQHLIPRQVARERRRDGIEDHIGPISKRLVRPSLDKCTSPVLALQLEGRHATYRRLEPSPASERTGLGASNKSLAFEAQEKLARSFRRDPDPSPDRGWRRAAAQPQASKDPHLGEGQRTFPRGQTGLQGWHIYARQHQVRDAVRDLVFLHEDPSCRTGNELARRCRHKVLQHL